MTEAPTAPSAINLAIKRMEPTFTASERRISRQLASNFPTAGLLTAAELGRLSNASTATISRFVAKLGFASYQEFQNSIRNEVRDRLESPLARFLPSAAVHDDVRAYASWAADLMREAGEMIVTAEFEGTLALLADRRRPVHIVGGRFSRSLAQLFAFGLTGLRNDVHLMGDGLQSLVDSTLDLGRRDIVVVFDFRRYQDEMIRFARAAAAAGATLVVFTDRWLSPAAEPARYVLALPVAGPSIYDSGLAPLMCIEAMVAALARRLGADAEQRVARAQSIYEKLS